MLYIVTTSYHAEVSKAIGSVLQNYQGQFDYKLVSPNDDLSMIQSGDTCLCMGKKTYDRFAGWGAVPKNRSVTSMRNKEVNYNGISLIFTFDPYAAGRDYSTRINMLLDTNLACRRVITGSIKPPLGDYSWAENFNEVLEYVESEYAKTGEGVPVAMDLETVGLDEVNPDAWIVSIFFTYKEGRSVGMSFDGHSDQPLPKNSREDVYRQLVWLFTTKKVKTIGANLKYDMRWILRKWGLWVDNFTFDTTLVGSLIDENRSNSLNTHAKLYTPIGGYDDEFNDKADKSRMDLELAKDRDSFSTYAGGDTDACLRVYNQQKKELLRDPQLTRFYINLLHPSSKTFTRMEHEGVRIDPERKAIVRSELEAEINNMQQIAESLMPARLKAKHQSKGLALTRAAVIQDFMFSPQGLNLKPLEFTEKSMKDPNKANWIPATTKQHLNKFKDHPDAGAFVEAYNNFNTAKKTMSTYIDGFGKFLRADGMFHPSYMLFRGDYGGDDSGTVTGRLSAKDPAIQTVPKHSKWAPRLRWCFRPPEGHLFFEIDFCAGELRVIAVVANEPTMIANFQAGKDPHVLGGAGISKMTYEEVAALEHTDPKLYKKIRQRGKPANFGLSYGMSANGFYHYARDSYGVDMTLAEAEEAHVGFFNMFDRLKPWHNEYHNFARQNGFIRTPLGRIRHLPLINHSDGFIRSKAERQAINSPIQATLSDLTQLAATLFEKEYGVFGSRSNPLRLCMMVHDALLGYVPMEHAAEWIPKLAEVMSNLPLGELFGWYPQVKFDVDSEVHHDNLSELMNFDKYMACKDELLADFVY
ncbi:DNA polymerase (plasmid) [Halobacteriovorax sp. GFR7]|uniref:DNA polymerase n=1 Tax=unclassified Halobacteriovorax TaxID=2639665 RepID=UPI003D96F89A